MSREFQNAKSNLLNETIEYACPRPQDFLDTYGFIIDGDRFRYHPCSICNLPKAFFHYAENFDSACNIETLHHIEISKYGSVMEVVRKNTDVKAFEESVKKDIKRNEESRQQHILSRSNSTPSSNLSLDDLVKALTLSHGPKIKCPKWSNGIRADNYIQSLEDWFLTCNIKNQVMRYTLVLEAFKESENDSLKPILDNFISSVRPEISETDPEKFASVLIPKFLKEKFHLNTLTRSVETWKKLLLLEHDPTQTEIFISNLHTLFEDCKQFNLDLSESQKAAFMLSKLNVDQNTYRNIVSNTDDLADPQVFKTLESNVRKNCNLPATVVSSVNYLQFDDRFRRSRSRDKYSNSSYKKDRSKSRSRSRDHRGRSKSRSKSRDDKNRRPSQGDRYSKYNESNTFVASQTSQANQNSSINEEERKLEIEDTYFSLDGIDSDLHCYKNFIIDTGAPSSIMSFDNAKKIIADFKKLGKPFKVDSVHKYFRFGPSRTYKSTQRLKFPLLMYKAELDVSFYIIDAPNIPNLLGQDVLDRLQVNIDLSGRNLIFKSKDRNGQILVPVRKLPTGHYAIPLTLTNVYFLVRDGPGQEQGQDSGQGAGQGQGEGRGQQRGILRSEGQEDEGRALQVHFVGTDEQDSGDNTQESPEIQSKKAVIIKIHRLTSHASANQLWKFLKRAYQFTNGDKKLIYSTLESCDVCSFYKKTNPRSKVCLPRSLQVNEIIAIDLKDFRSKFGFYILYIVDLFSRLMMGVITPDKKPESIIKGLNEWAVGKGAGLGWPKAIFSDNGSEFVNTKMSDLTSKLNIVHKTTPSYTPNANGLNERRHWTCDVLFEKAKSDNLNNLSDQQLLDSVIFFQNSEIIDDLGFSPLQIVTGRNPALMNANDFPLPSAEFDCGSEYVRSLLATQGKIRSYVRSNDVSNRVDQFMSQSRRVSAVQDKLFQNGQKIIFQDPVDNVWKRATLVCKVGRSCSIDIAGQIRKVDLSRLDYDRQEEWNKLISDTIEQIDNKVCNKFPSAVFPQPNPIVSGDVHMSQPPQLSQAATHTQGNTHPLDTPTHTHSQHTHTAQLFPQGDDISSKSVKSISDVFTRDLFGDFQVEGQGENLNGRPKNHSFVKVKHNDSINPIFGQVIFVAKGKSRNNLNFTIKFLDHKWQCAIGKNISSWEYIAREDFDMLIKICQEALSKGGATDTFFSIEDICMVSIPPREQGTPEILRSKLEELNKWHRYNVMETVDFDHQQVIPTHWVVTEKKDEKESNKCQFKARLCVRGDREFGYDRTDSPTAPRDLVRLLITLSALLGYKMHTLDISSAFLQSGHPGRSIFLRPPEEANLEGKLWLLKKGVYGLADASRLWFLKFKNFLLDNNFEQLGDSDSVFMLKEAGKITGLVATHVDDIMYSGSENFISWFNAKVSQKFTVSKFESEAFTYTGIDIISNDQEITLNQHNAAQKLNFLDISSFKEGETGKQGEHLTRQVVGQTGWLVYQTRPDIAFRNLELSTVQQKPSLQNLKDCNKLIKLAKEDSFHMRYPMSNGKTKWSDYAIWSFTDASHALLDNKEKSSEGRLLFLVNMKNFTSYPLAWKSGVIKTVCKDIKSAETRALVNGLDEAIYFRDIFDSAINHKFPILSFTDNKSLKDSLYSTNLITDKSLRLNIAYLKQRLENRDINKISWVSTDMQLADILTKSSVKFDILKSIFQKGKFSHSFVQKINSSRTKTDYVCSNYICAYSCRRIALKRQ